VDLWEWDLLAKAEAWTVNNQQQQYFSLPPLPLLVNISVRRAKAFRHQLSRSIHQNKCCLTRRYRIAVVASCCLQAIVAPVFIAPLDCCGLIRTHAQPDSLSCAQQTTPSLVASTLDLFPRNIADQGLHHRHRLSLTPTYVTASAKSS
jgi:hypothetical protein